MFDFLPFPLIDSYAMFFIYSFIGWILEVIYYGVTEGRFINRGFCNGPLCPVYGIGFYCVIWAFMPLMSSFPLLFVCGALVCSVVELIAGVVLYALFQLRWWDYTTYRWNYKGFICVRFTFYWGIACSFGMYLLRPAVNKFIAFLNPKFKAIILIIFTVVLVIDIIVTVLTIFKVNKRLKFITNISGGIRKYSDKIGSQIYGTVDTIVNKTTPAMTNTKDTYSEFRALYAKHRFEEKQMDIYHPEETKALAKRNRAEERAMISSYFSSGKNSIVKTTSAAGKKIKGSVSRLRSPEFRLLARIKTSKTDENNEAIQYIIDNYMDALEDEIRANRDREGICDYEDTGML